MDEVSPEGHHMRRLYDLRLMIDLDKSYDTESDDDAIEQHEREKAEA